MVTSKKDANETLFASACERVELALKERTAAEEVTYVSVEGLPDEMIRRIQELYRDSGWTVIREYCAGEYEDLWFS